MSDKLWTAKSFKQRFRHENDCLKALLEYRTGEADICFNPKCDAPISKSFKKLKAKKAFICIKCLKHYYPMNGSIFSNCHIPIQDYFSIVFSTLYSRNGISANEISRIYGFSYPTAFRIIHAIRSQMMECMATIMFPDNAAIEVDESFIKVGQRGMSRHTYLGTGRGNKTHATILVISERGGPAKLFPIESASFEVISELMKKHVSTKSLVYTDSWSAYEGLSNAGYKNHTMVNHSETYVNGSASTNNCESVFGNLKRTIKGTYRNVSEKMLINYLNESAFRHTFRNELDYGWDKLMKSLKPLSEVYHRRSAA